MGFESECLRRNPQSTIMVDGLILCMFFIFLLLSARSPAIPEGGSYALQRPLDVDDPFDAGSLKLSLSDL